MTKHLQFFILRLLALAFLVGSWHIASSAPNVLGHNEITVNTTTDEYNTGANCSLREAVKTANDNSDFGGCTRVLVIGGGIVDKILLPVNTYDLTINGYSEDGDTTGDLDIAASVIISTTGVSYSTVRGETNWDDRIFHILTGTITINHMAIGGGHTLNNVAGGAVRIEAGAALTLNDSDVANSTAEGNAGGILNLGTLTLNNSNVHEDTANGVNGGGGTFSAADAVLSMQNSIVYLNNAASGAGIYADTGSVLTVTNSIIHDNTSQSNSGSTFGGGIYFKGSSFLMSQSTVNANSAEPDGGGLELDGTSHVIQYSFITGNTISGHPGTPSAHGAGIDVLAGNRNTIIRDSIISNNAATNNNPSGSNLAMGGGIFAGGTMTITNSLISGNQTNGADISGKSAGGIYSPASLTIINSTLSGNSTIGDIGGALEVASGTSSLANVTITNNTAKLQGGVNNTASGTLNLRNTIIAGNTSTFIGGEDDCQGTLTSQGYNLTGDSGCMSGDTTGNQTNTSASLASLLNNGGPVVGYSTTSAMLTHALNSDSPAIDAGNPGGCNDPNNVVLLTDQRGYVRHRDGPDADVIPQCDIGAFEYNSIPLNQTYIPFVARTAP